MQNGDLESQGYNGYAAQLRDINYNDVRPENYIGGFYVVASSINAPFGEGWTYLILMAFNISSCIQIALGDANSREPKIKIRTLVSDVWGNWTQVI